MSPSRSQRAILRAMAGGELLRSHREMDGRKSFRLHQPGGQWRSIGTQDVHELRAAGLIDSNKKFPVATFWLTDAGQALLSNEP